MIIGKDTLILYSQSEGQTLANGDYVPGSLTASNPIPCDAVPSGKATAITYADGTTGSYAYEITLDVDCPDFAFGDLIKLSVSGHEPHEYSIKGFHRYQFLSKLWV